MVQDGGNTYLPAYDALGSIHAMIKAADGSLAAAYEYDAFGNTLRASGSYAASNPFRFSTKFSDDETGLAYYGLRYYSPTLGRFINKDPLEEKGGLNLYGFCTNNGVNRWDYLGQDATTGIGTRADGSTYFDYGAVAYGQHGTPQSLYQAVQQYQFGVNSPSVVDGSFGQASISSGGTNGTASSDVTLVLPTLHVTASSGANLTDSINQAAFDLYGHGAYPQGPINTFDLYPTTSVQGSAAPHNAGGGALSSTLGALGRAGSALFRAGATTAEALATAGRYAGPAIGEAIIRNNNLKLKVGFEGGEVVNFAQSFTRDLDFFESSTDMGLGASAIAYGGIEWEIRHPQLGNTPPAFSFSTTAADGLAGGVTFDFGMVQWGDTRIPWLVNVKPFLGVGLGGSLKLELPTPSVTGTSTKVNMHTGAVGGLGP